LAVISPTSGGRSIGIVRSRTQDTEFVFVHVSVYEIEVSVSEALTVYATGNRSRHHKEMTFSQQARTSVADIYVALLFLPVIFSMALP
jgi:hypothetical protein